MSRIPAEWVTPLWGRNLCYRCLRAMIPLTGPWSIPIWSYCERCGTADPDIRRVGSMAITVYREKTP